MPDACLVSRRAGKLEHYRIAFTTSLDLFRIEIIARHLYAIDRLALISLGISPSIGIAVDQGNDVYSVRRILTINLDGAVKVCW
jgi:hypothetical protein